MRLAASFREIRCRLRALLYLISAALLGVTTIIFRTFPQNHLTVIVTISAMLLLILTMFFAADQFFEGDKIAAELRDASNKKEEKDS
jgi:hypothetical protein